MNLKLTILATSMLGASTSSALAPVAPVFAEAFASEPNIALWSRMIVTMPAIAVALAAPLMGVVTDRFGRKPVLVASLLLYLVAGTSGLWAPDLVTVIVGRFVLGIAVAGIFTAITAVIGDRYLGMERSRMIGLQSGAIGTASVTFTILGGILADQSWRAPFWVYLGVLLVLPMALTLAPDPPTDSVSPNSPTDEPVIGPRMRRLLLAVYAGIFAIQIGFISAALQLPFQIRELTGGTTIAGLAIASMGIAFSVTSIVVQRISWPLAPVGRIAVGFVGVGVGTSLLSQLSPLPLGIGLVIAGIGYGIIQPTLVVALNQGVPNTLRGRASGGFTTALFLGQFVAPFIAQPLGDLIGISPSFIVLGVGFIVLAGILGAIHRSQQRRIPAARSA
ncbi:MAG: MFS transporter [Chloroflexi bacterium]|nr:MFS transporter [Chloroflexota bacterium]